VRRDFRGQLASLTMAPGNTAFSYSTVPLNDPSKRTIRIIELLPKLDDQIQCNLHTVSLDDSPYYEALSYRWGDPIFSHPIICNGCILNITTSLHGALQRLRHPSLSRWLWADAICINQSAEALEERDAQVRIMRDIYENAQQVNIWLGEAENNSYHAVYIIKQLARHRSTLEGWGRQDYWTKEQLQQVELHFGNYIDKEWAAIQPFFDRPWFRRIWTVQEVAAARYAVIFCGPEEIPWTEMVSGLEVGVSTRLLHSKRALNPDTLDFFDPAHAAQLSHSQGLQRSSKYSGYNFDSLLSYLLWFRRREATNPLDKVFALLGLVKDDALAAIISPHYVMTVKGLYTMLTQQSLERAGNLDVLSAPRGTPKVSFHLPSWVVDWNDSSTSTMSLVGQSRFKYSATGSSRASIKFSHNNQVLDLKGRVVDTISCIASVLQKSHAFYSPPMESWSSTIRQFSSTLDNLSYNQKGLIEWEMLALDKSSTIYHTGELMADVFHQTLYAGLPPEYNMKADYEDWRGNALPGNLPKHVDSTKHPWLFKGAVWLQVFQDAAGKSEQRQYTTMAYGRRLGKTSNGYLALLPADTRVGDSVVLCEGGQTPLILRSNGSAFELVGDSYVHGMMNGELFRPLESTTIRIV
jgi:Heterokaryon incompatibility protein (HET)